MLSAESAAGKYPVESVTMQQLIINKVEVIRLSSAYVFFGRLVRMITVYRPKKSYRALILSPHKIVFRLLFVGYDKSLCNLLLFHPEVFFILPYTDDSFY